MGIPQLSPYRHPGELPILLLTLGCITAILVAASSLISHWMFVWMGVGLAMTYAANRTRHLFLMRSAQRVNHQSARALAEAAEACYAILQPGPVELFVARNPALNAYAFWLSDPKVVVLYSALFHEMDGDEIRFVLGHEVGHISLGHTRINSLLGGMAGVPSTFLASTLFNGAFLWWNRYCEYSADRAGLLACGNPDKAYSALVKLSIGATETRLSIPLAEVLQKIEKEEGGGLAGLEELLATHPRVFQRVRALQKFAASCGF